MVSQQVGYEGNGKRRGKEVALDKAEIHNKEEKNARYKPIQW